jgi:hypothetical protein
MRGKARQDQTRQDRDKARQYNTRQHNTTQHNTAQDKSSQVRARQRNDDERVGLFSSNAPPCCGLHTCLELLTMGINTSLPPPPSLSCNQMEGIAAIDRFSGVRISYNLAASHITFAAISIFVSNGIMPCYIQ